LKVQPKQEGDLMLPVGVNMNSEEQKPKEDRVFPWLPPLTRDVNTSYASVKRVESKSAEEIDREIAKGN
jgi:hypothetical protein